jgi:2-dehydropantoate 2-reductase
MTMPDSDKPKIAVIGAGAIGSLLGGLLARAGEDVTLIGRPAHVQAIHAKGLHIDGVLGELVVQVKAADTLEFRPDVALLAVKTQDIEATCRQYAGLLQDVRLVTLQNGVRSDDIVASVLPRHNILSGVVVFNAQYLEPGRVTYALGGLLVIGEAFAKNGLRAAGMRALLAEALHTRLSDNIRGAHFTKLLVNNLANGLEAMTGLSIQACMRQGRLRRIGAAMFREGYCTVTEAGIRLEPVPGIPLSLLQLIAQVPVPLAAAMLGLSMGSLNTMSSTLQSLRRGRPTEIDYLNGEIARLGQKAGTPTPYNALVVELVKEAEACGQFSSPDVIARRFAALG